MKLSEIDQDNTQSQTSINVSRLRVALLDIVEQLDSISSQHANARNINIVLASGHQRLPINNITINMINNDGNIELDIAHATTIELNVLT